jgi:hypothetical protein
MRLLRIFLFVFCFMPTSLIAQVGETTEIIRGRVTDPEGKPVVGARVAVTSAESGISKTTITDSNGRYTLFFRDGGGRYQITISFLGYQDRTINLVRQADEDVLIANAEMSVQAIAIQGIEVTARRPAPGRGETAQQGRDLPDNLVQRLPLENFDPTSLASLSAGVVITPGDSLDIRGGFSVAGQREALNQVTLDGGSFGNVLSGGAAGSPLSVPQEGVRRTQVVTNTYDVARGQFSGGQVAMTTRGGNNRTTGSFSWNLRDPVLQAGDRNTTGNLYTQNRLSGGIGGPIQRNKLFYNLSFTYQRRSDDLFALQSDDSLAVERLGTDPDSVARFIDILENVYAVPTAGQTGSYSRIGNALSLLGRFDWNVSDRHNVMVRGNTNFYDQGNARIGLLELRQSGGDVETDGYGGMITMTSRFGQGWINDARFSFNQDGRDQLPFIRVPEGRVRVTSLLEDSLRSVSNLGFGGERSMPVNTSERTIELMNELSFLLGDTHRLKLGLLINDSKFTQLNTNNVFGSFTFNSLEDFEAGSPASFTRNLAPRSKEGGGLNAAMYTGDTWRPTLKLQLTYGLRFEYSNFAGEPANNPDVELAVGRRTDVIPSEFHVSPRLGFSYRLSETGAPLTLVRGGVGEFRGRAPFSLFAAAQEQTGLAEGERQLQCIGEFVPVPDWALYQTDESAIPTACGDGSTPAPIATARRNVTVFNPDFGAPRSWRASLGLQKQLFTAMQVSVDAMYTRGVGLYGVHDLNLDEATTTRLGIENRLFFGNPAGVAQGSGETTFLSSRIHPEYGHVFEVDSDLESSTAQITATVSGMLPPRFSFQTSYTLMRARDQSSFSCCNPTQGFSSPTTGENPNRVDWGVSNLDRRHIITAILGYNVNRFADVTLIGRISSGQPFTPMVGGDVNGDGVRNDRAFIFAPNAAPDTAVANSMSRLLANAPGRVRECLQDQLGEIADRNSCRGEWYQSLDARVNIRPGTSTLARRINLSLDFSNVLAGLDRLFHDDDDLSGWGQHSRPDATLLYPRGFDATTQTFRYVVNEQFGQSRTQRFGFGQPFQAQLQVRVAVGAQQGGAGLAAIAGGGGGRGGAAGGRAGGPGGPGAGQQSQRFDPAEMIDRMMANNPVKLIIELRDSLALSAEQVARLQIISDTLDAQVTPLAEEAKKKLEGSTGSGQGQQQMMEVFRELGPSLQEARRHLNTALQESQKVLTSEQWAKVPANIRNVGRAGGRFNQ